MKRILEVFSFHGGYMGGIATMIKSYLEGKEEFAKYDCQLYSLNIKPTVKTGMTSVDNFAYIFTQRKEARRHLILNKYDLVHIHTSREFLFFKDILLAKLIKDEFHIPVVLTIHVGSMETVYNRIKWFQKRSIKILNKYVNKTIFLSHLMQDEFVRGGMNKNNSTVLYNFHNFVPIAEPINVSEESDKLKLLYVGAIHREKGIIELLTALSQLPNLNFNLCVCGKLTDKSIKKEIQILKKNLGNKVSFLGYVSGVDKTFVFKNSDILVLPSYHEGSPLVIMEALGAGCAIMSTKVGAIPEILTTQNCYWLEIASVESIKYALSKYNYNEIKKMKKRNILKGKEFSFSKHVKTLCDIYLNL